MHGGQIGLAVAKARRRLARVAGRRTLARRAWWIVGAAALLAALRPLLWPLVESDPLWFGAARALVLLPIGLALGTAALLLWGRRHGPEELAVVRAMDECLDGNEVLASGWAFERSDRRRDLEALARHRASRAARSFDADTSFPLPSLKPRTRNLLLAFVLGFVAVVVGAWDPLLADVLVNPPDSSEVLAAGELEVAAAALEEPIERERDRGARIERDTPEAERTARAARDEDRRELAHKARDAARAARRGDRRGARRGDRRGALRRLDELRREAGQRARRARSLEEAAMRAERLDAERREASRSAEALARLLERAGLLERAVQLAMMGRPGQGASPAGAGSPRPGAGEGRGGDGGEGNLLVRELAARLAALGLGEGRGRPGGGPGGHVPDRGDAHRSGIEASGELHARSLVREGIRERTTV